MADLIPVRMRDCACPGAPHADGDYAYLKPEADVKVGLAANSAIYTGGPRDLEEIQVALGVAYTWSGVVQWDLLDPEGQPLPVSKANVTALKWTDVAPIADKASELYSADIINPLVARASKSSPSGRTKGSTPQRKRSTSRRRKQS